MAKKKKSPGDDAADAPVGDDAAEDIEVVSLPDQGEATKTMQIICDRDELRVGDRVREKGELLATIVLEHDVNVGFVTRALEDCLARAVHVAE